jgi:hypothetical protein
MPKFGESRFNVDRFGLYRLPKTYTLSMLLRRTFDSTYEASMLLNRPIDASYEAGLILQRKQQIGYGMTLRIYPGYGEKLYGMGIYLIRDGEQPRPNLRESESLTVPAPPLEQEGSSYVPLVHKATEHKPRLGSNTL